MWDVPALRFPEFSGEWEKCVISDFGTVITGNTPPTQNISNYKDGIKLWASPADLGKTKWIYDTQTKLSVTGFDKTRKLPEGAILVTCIGSTIGKMGMATEEMSTNQQINSIITNSCNDNNFVYYAIESNFPKYIASIAVQAVPIISKSSFERLSNKRTCLKEQIKIGKFLSLIDKRIETQNKVIEKLQSLIKGLAVALTTKEKPNTAISQCLECHSSTLQESEVLPNGLCKVFGANGLVGYVNHSQINGDAILIIKDGSSVGTISYAQGKFSVIGTLNYLTVIGDYDLRYLYFALSVFNFQPYKTGMAIPHIYFKDYSNAKIYCPPLAGQRRIATMLDKLESKLFMEQNILVSLNLQKSYLLRYMFI